MARPHDFTLTVASTGHPGAGWAHRLHGFFRCRAA